MRKGHGLLWLKQKMKQTPPFSYPVPYIKRKAIIPYNKMVSVRGNLRTHTVSTGTLRCKPRRFVIYRVISFSIRIALVSYYGSCAIQLIGSLRSGSFQQQSYFVLFLCSE